MLHWNGKAWRQVTGPAPVTGGNATAVTATAKRGWAVGYVNTGSNTSTTVILHWNGKVWS
jgi:hypothetical protein